MKIKHLLKKNSTKVKFDFLENIKILEIWIKIC